MRSDVFYVKLNSGDPQAHQQAFKELLSAANLFAHYKKDEYIPVKITLGDTECVHNVSPGLVKLAIIQIKSQKAKPFLFDTSVIYKGGRHNALDHMNLAQRKGFNSQDVGAQFIVADGVFGQDGKEYIVAGEEIRKIKIPSFVGMVNNLTVISHVTGHIVSAYAAAIKNVAMGMCCRPTKQVQHSSLKPKVVEENCTACACCMAICPVEAIELQGKSAFIDQKKCLGCGECLCACKFDAISINWHEDPLIFCKRMVEVAGFILSKFKSGVYINFALNITKECDCISTKNDPMVSENFGILASRDILALDKCTADLALKHKLGSFLSEHEKLYQDTFSYAQKRGLGNLEYNLIEV